MEHKNFNVLQAKAIYLGGHSITETGRQLGGISAWRIRTALVSLGVELRSGPETNKLRTRRNRRHAYRRPDGSWAIPLSNGGETIVDEQDADLSWEYTYRCNRDGYAHCVLSRESHQLHQKIAERLGFDPSLQVDHKNRDKLDNRRSNLRQATGTENKLNTIRRPGQSGIVGVSLVRIQAGTRFCANVRTRSGRKSRVFKRLVSAIVWRNWLGRREFGEFFVPTPKPRRVARPAAAVAA